MTQGGARQVPGMAQQRAHAAQQQADVAELGAVVLPTSFGKGGSSTRSTGAARLAVSRTSRKGSRTSHAGSRTSRTGFRAYRTGSQTYRTAHKARLSAVSERELLSRVKQIKRTNSNPKRSSRSIVSRSSQHTAAMPATAADGSASPQMRTGVGSVTKKPANGAKRLELGQDTQACLLM
jgi:hypothetical protein